MGRYTSKRHSVPVAFIVAVTLASVRLSYAVAPLPSDDVDLVGPSEECVPYKSDNKNEEWAWKKICAGEEVDFSRRDGVRLDPRIAEPGRKEWENRAIGSRFLETVLLHEPYRSAIPRKGVRIVGAYLMGPLDLADATLARPLVLTLTRFDSDVDLRRLRTNARVGLDQCGMPSLRMESVSVAGSVSLKEADLGSLLMSGARIEGNLTMNGSVFYELLDMEGAIVAGDVTLTGTPRMHTVEASKAKIGGEFVIGSARTHGNFRMDSGRVGGDFIIGDVDGDTTFDGEFILIGTEVGDQLSMVDVKFGGRAHLEAVAVGGTLFLRESEIRGEANLRFIRVGRNLDARGGTFGRVDLTRLLEQGPSSQLSQVWDWPVRRPFCSPDHAASACPSQRWPTSRSYAAMAACKRVVDSPSSVADRTGPRTRAWVRW